MTHQSMGETDTGKEDGPPQPAVTEVAGDEPARPPHLAPSLKEMLVEEGRTEAALRMARLVLERRCGELDQDLLNALEEMNRTILEALAIYPPSVIEQARALAGRYGFTRLALAWRVHGREEEACTLTRLVLEGRFETLDTELYQAISQADEPTLREVIKHTYRDSLEQIRARLGLSV